MRQLLYPISSVSRTFCKKKKSKAEKAGVLKNVFYGESEYGIHFDKIIISKVAEIASEVNATAEVNAVQLPGNCVVKLTLVGFMFKRTFHSFYFPSICLELHCY